MAFFFVILTADPAGACTWINIYFKRKSGVYFGKRISKALDLHTGQPYAPINVMPAGWGGGGEGGAWGGDLIVFVGAGVGHLTVPGEGIFESFFARRGDTVEPRSTDTRFTRTVSFVPTKSSYVFSKFNTRYMDTG